MTMLRCSWAVCSGSMKRLQKAPSLAGPGHPAVCLGCQFNALCAGLGGGYRHHVFDG